MVEIEMLDDDEPTMDSSQYFQKNVHPDRLKLLRKLEHSLPQELAMHNAYYDDLVNMIPMLSLIQNSDSNVEKGPSKKYHKTGSDPLTNNAKEGRKIANKLSKRRKLNTATSEKEELSSEMTPSNLLKEKNVSTSPTHPTIPVTPPTSTTKADDDPTTTSSSNLSRIEALRIKLQNAIAAKQQRGGASDSAQVSKRAARRAERNRRQSATLSHKAQPTTTRYTVGSAAATTTTTTTTVDPPTPAADIQNIDYGRLAGLDYFAATATTKETKDILQKMTNNKKNLHRLLADAERKKQQLEELKNSQDPKDKEKAQNMQWSETFKEADGVRLKNDPSKIKKALKRKEAKKKKSQKAWKSRTEQVQSKQLERQQIRQHNVTARKQGGAAGANLSKKKIKETAAAENNPASRRARPGFEGRRHEFLNAPKHASSHESKKQGAVAPVKK